NNIIYFLIRFDFPSTYRLGTDYFKSTVKSMIYKSVPIEWE
ncbi:uncharacterized protein METZ01_LOCUS487564, partial [marine metagenome]